MGSEMCIRDSRQGVESVGERRLAERQVGLRARGGGGEDDESEEAREARLAEYAAAKAEEDAIKQVKYGGFRIRAW